MLQMLRNKAFVLVVRDLCILCDFNASFCFRRAQIQAAFEAVDTNKDNFIDPDEAKAVLLPKGYTEQQIEDRFAQFDRDRDGLLNYHEYAAFYDVPIN